MAELDNTNLQVIDEFRANAGKMSGFLAGAPVLLLMTTGAKSGKRCVTPLMYLSEGERLVVFASKAGAPTNPDWYYNLVAHPKATIDVGTESFDVTASVITGEERDQLYAKWAAFFPMYAEYEKMTTRKIPVIALQR